MISEHKINYQFGPPPPGVGPPEIVCFSNQTDFTATRVPGGPEAGQALAFRRPSVTPELGRNYRNDAQLRGSPATARRP
jgi:hypothetical protein